MLSSLQIIPPNVKRKFDISSPSAKTKVGHRSYETETTVSRKAGIRSSEKYALQQKDLIVVNEVEEFEKTVSITIHNDCYTVKLIKEPYCDIIVCQNILVFQC